MKNPSLIICPYEASYANETVFMWRTSKEKAIGQKEIHSFESHIYFLNHILPENHKIFLALENDKVVGMIAFNMNEISQLYIHIDYQGRGVGQDLLNFCKRNSRGRLKLRTFEVNKAAQGFYKKNGFVEIGRGHGNEENLPDIEYEWCSKE
ncbi:GNAT family N-acetyltransferase [Cytobacillus purgationiresistens]|nr:GNAT family N-acetyltransferase [Cytobacillus purgationiresistens]